MEIDLEDLQDLPPFEVTLAGEACRDLDGLGPCLYAEATYGEKRGSAWVQAWRAVVTDRPLTVTTPHGTVTVTPRRLRLHLTPALVEVYARSSRDEVPSWVEAALQEVAGDLTTEAYCLTAGRTYWAQVVGETFHLPPRGGAPRVKTHWVLRLADRPFQDGEPPGPGTPATSGRVY